MSGTKVEERLLPIVGDVSGGMQVCVVLSGFQWWRLSRKGELQQNPFELEKKLLRVIKSLASEEEKRMKRDFQQDARSLKKSEWL